jgi:hypothetical protein
MRPRSVLSEPDAPLNIGEARIGADRIESGIRLAVREQSGSLLEGFF